MSVNVSHLRLMNLNSNMNSDISKSESKKSKFLQGIGEVLFEDDQLDRNVEILLKMAKYDSSRIVDEKAKDELFFQEQVRQVSLAIGSLILETFGEDRDYLRNRWHVLIALAIFSNNNLIPSYLKSKFDKILVDNLGSFDKKMESLEKINVRNIVNKFLMFKGLIEGNKFLPYIDYEVKNISEYKFSISFDIYHHTPQITIRRKQSDSSRIPSWIEDIKHEFSLEDLEVEFKDLHMNIYDSRDAFLAKSGFEKHYITCDYVESLKNKLEQLKKEFYIDDEEISPKKVSITGSEDFIPYGNVVTLRDLQLSENMQIALLNLNKWMNKHLEKPIQMKPFESRHITIAIEHRSAAIFPRNTNLQDIISATGNHAPFFSKLFH